jgi:hypothetical protein
MRGQPPTRKASVIESKAATAKDQCLPRQTLETWFPLTAQTEARTVDCLVGGGGSSLGRLGWNGRRSQNLTHGGVLSLRGAARRTIDRLSTEVLPQEAGRLDALAGRIGNSFRLQAARHQAARRRAISVPAARPGPAPRGPCAGRRSRSPLPTPRTTRWPGGTRAGSCRSRHG